MSNVKTIGGAVVNTAGAPLPSKTVTLKNDDTGASITTTTTNADGEWEFANRDETIRYRADAAFGGSSSQIVVRKPASAEFDHLYANLSFRSAAAATVVIGGALSVGGALNQSGGYAYLGSWNVGAPLYPTAGTALAVGWNYNAGAQDISLFNTATGATTAFSFNHLTGASTATLLMRLMANGSLQLGNTGAAGGPGDLTVKGAASSNADLTLIEGDTDNGWNLGVVVADDSFRISRWAASAFTDLLTISTAGAEVIGSLVVTSGQLLLDGPLTVAGDATFNNAATFTIEVTMNQPLSALTGILVDGGSLAAPEVACISDPDTGIVFNGAGAMQLASNGAAQLSVGPNALGFYSTAAVAKPTVTGSRGANAALTSLCAALATLGLITNSTS